MFSVIVALTTEMNKKWRLLCSDIDDCILDSDLMLGRESIKKWTCNYRQKGISMLGLFLFMAQSVTRAPLLILSVNAHTHTHTFIVIVTGTSLCIIKISPASPYSLSVSPQRKIAQAISVMYLLSIKFFADVYSQMPYK